MGHEFSLMKLINTEIIICVYPFNPHESVSHCIAYNK